MRKLRVLHCLETVGSGGVEQRKLISARKLDKARYEQALICTQAIGGLPEEFVHAGCPIREIGVFGGMFDRKRYRNALAFVKEFNPDIIHGAVYEGVATAALTGRWAGVPIIIGEETSDPTNRRWRGHLLYRGLASLTHHMIAVSPAVRKYLVRRIRLPANKVTLINNGVDESAPVDPAELQALCDHLGIGRDDVVIGSCGRLFDSYKRFSDLIGAFAKIRAESPLTKLLIVGDGPDAAMLRRLAQDLGAAEHVIFVGYQADPRPYYRLMDIFALASAHEAFGLVLVEAMFAGLPVVATCVGGIPDVVVEGETGLLVPPFDPDALAQCCLDLIHDAARRAQLGRAGLSRAKAEFSAERYVRDVDQLYQRLATERGIE